MTSFTELVAPSDRFAYCQIKPNLHSQLEAEKQSSPDRQAALEQVAADARWLGELRREDRTITLYELAKILDLTAVHLALFEDGYIFEEEFMHFILDWCRALQIKPDTLAAPYYPELF